MELAFTPAKNATKPNPFKIMPLQSTGKENNWETEETLLRAPSGDGTGKMAQTLMFMMMISKLFQAGRRTDGRSEMTEPSVAFRNITNAPK
jgi:hypothetical protein